VARPLRYTFILVLVALGTTLAAVGGWRYARASAPVPGPIILISIDTLRADHLPAYGYDKIKTPAIDGLAEDGIVFERAYSHSPQTLPSHVSMLTGRLPFETGVRDDDAGLKANERLLAQMLRERGYATAGVVSSGLLRRATGLAQGFDFFDDQMPADDRELTASQRRRDGRESEAIAENWLDSVGSTRVFLFLHLDDPHAPGGPVEHVEGTPPYDGQIAYADEVLGRFLRYLKKHQLYDQSTIVLVSDHGEGLGDHGELQHGLFVYDENIRVPLIVKQAAGLGAGRRVTDIVQHADIVPTVLDLARAPIPRNLRGRSLKPLTDGTGAVPETVVYSESQYGRNRFGWSDLVSIRDGRFEYIRAPHEELYDIQRDPHERDNLAGAGATPRRRAELRSALARLLGEEPAAIVSGAKDSDVAAIDPKDKVEIAEWYLNALDLVVSRQWPKAIELFQRIARQVPDSADVWNQLARVAELMDRNDLALSAYQHVIDLDSSDPRPLIQAARVSLVVRKLDEAEDLGMRALDAAGLTPRALADAHAVLTSIALARHDADAAREHSAAARKADPSSLLPLYVDAKLLYEEGDFAGALTRLEKANAAILKDQSAPVPGLHQLTAQALIWADRPAEAETHLLDELKEYPHNLEARAALATLYQSGDEYDQAAGVVSDLVRITPTPDAYTLAAKLWASLGDQKQAAAARADSRRLLGTRRNAH